MQEGVATSSDLSAEEMDVVRKRAVIFRKDLEARLRAIAPGLLAEGDGVTLSRRNGYSFHLRVQYGCGVRYERLIWDCNLLHDSEARLAFPFETHARSMRAGFEAFEPVRRLVEAQKDLIEQCASETGLPIRYHIVPGIQHNGNSYYDILIEGYGPTGLPAFEPVRSELATLDFLTALSRCDHALKIQRARHRAFGPRPGAKAGAQWTVDAPTARMLARTGRGSELARQAVLGHEADFGDAGVRIRVKGTSLLGTFEIAPGVTWKGDRLDAEGVQLSDIVSNAIAGHSLRSVVEHPVFSQADVALRAATRHTKARSRKPLTILTVSARPEMIPIERIDDLEGQ